jgi:hypothetical protein
MGSIALGYKHIFTRALRCVQRSSTLTVQPHASNSRHSSVYIGGAEPVLGLGRDRGLRIVTFYDPPRSLSERSSAPAFSIDH